MKTKPMEHQKIGLIRSEGKRNFAFLMEQGTGKTWTTLADAERCFIGNKIDALAVIAPNGVHTNWVRREIPTHLEVESVSYAWRGNPTSKKAQAELGRLYLRHYAPGTAPLRVFSINIDAVMTKAGEAALTEFLTCYRTMLVVDESTRIKNPKAKRTKKVVELGKLATARRILTGTPITKAPTDLFSQFDFLKPGLLGTTSYAAFVAEHAVLLEPGSPQMQAIMRKLAGKVRGVPQVVATDDNGNKLWKNLDKLSDMIVPHSYRVRKDECLDLPPKVYKVVPFQLEPKQRAVYDKLKEDYHYVHDSEDMGLMDMKFEAIAARTKLKQVTSGFVNVFGEPQLIDPKENPRMAAFKEVIEDIQGQFIVWAIYEEEINQILAALEEQGLRVVSYYGKTKKEAREKAIDDFQAGLVDVFVGHAAAAGIGLTLTKAETAVYYSCDYDNEKRMQSEDRNHRIGTVNSVLYIDLIAEDTVDEDVHRSLMVKSALADTIIDRKH